MKDPTQRVDIVDLNADKLPYLDGRFSLVTCIETIARVEQIRPILREIFRVLEPGGLTVISTPNILNLPSRLRYLMTGFLDLESRIDRYERRSRLPWIILFL